MTEIGTQYAAGARASDRVAGAAFAHEGLHIGPSLRILRRGGRLKRVPLPRLEMIRIVGDDFQTHMGMLPPAIFRALAAIDAGLARFEPGLVDLARNEIRLAIERRYPERMNDVGGA